MPRVTAGPTSAASRPRPPGRCMPARWSRRWPAGSMRAPTAGAGWCASRTSTRRAASPARTQTILAQLAACGLLPDEAPVWQSRRGALYAAALEQLMAAGLAYPCGCSRHDIEQALARAGRPHARATASCVYPGTCRDGPAAGAPPRAWRVHGERPGRRRSLDRPPARRAAAGRGARGRRLRAQARRRPLGLPARGRGRRCRSRASPTSCAAKTWPTTRRGRSCCSARSACRRRATCTRRWCSAPTARSCRSRTAPQPLDTQPSRCWPLECRRAVLGLAATEASTPQALAAGVEWRALQSGRMTARQTPRTTRRSDGWPHPAPSRKLVRRAGRTTDGQATAFEQLGPRFLLPYRASRWTSQAAFGRDAPTMLEIGFGMGEATAHIAALMPEKNFLCCEVHEPGVGALLKRIGEQASPTSASAARRGRGARPHAAPPAGWPACTCSFPTPGTRRGTTSAA